MRRSRLKEYHGHHCAVSWVVPPTPARLRATSHWVTSTAALQVREAEEMAEDRGCQVERNVRDDDSTVGRRVSKDVALGDADVGSDPATGL